MQIRRQHFNSALGYAAAAVDRGGDARNDAAFIAAAAADPAALTYVLGGDRAMLAPGEPTRALFTPVEAAALGEAAARLYLGRAAAGGPRFATVLPAADLERLAAAGTYLAVDLRSLATEGLLPAEDIGALGLAKSLAAWHARHGFCPNCGAATAIVSGGWRRLCPACGAEHYPRVDPVAIMLVSDGERALLGRQPRFAPGRYSCLAGFVEPGETIEAAVRREVLEEAGIRVGTVSYLASQPWPFPSSLMLACRGVALSCDIVIDPTELEEARWFDRAELALMLAGTHPDGLGAPPPMAIAHHLIRHFVEEAAPLRQATAG
jgi:NAD+ diphosphatase